MSPQWHSVVQVVLALHGGKHETFDVLQICWIGLILIHHLTEVRVVYRRHVHHRLTDVQFRICAI